MPMVVEVHPDAATQLEAIRSAGLVQREVRPELDLEQRSVVGVVVADQGPGEEYIRT